MRGFAYFVKNKNNDKIQGMAYIKDERSGYSSCIRCYPHRGSNIHEGVVLLESKDNYVVKRREDGSEYCFIRGNNVETTTFDSIDPMVIKRNIFESVLIEGYGTPVNNSDTMKMCKAGDSLIYVWSHTAYVVANGQLYMLGNDHNMIDVILKELEQVGNYKLAGDIKNAVLFMNRILVETGDRVVDKSELEGVDMGKLNNVMNMLRFTGAPNGMHFNTKLMTWMKAKKKDCLPFGVESSIRYCMVDSWKYYNTVVDEAVDNLKQALKENPDTIFEQFLYLDELIESRLEILLDKSKYVIKNVETKQRFLYNLTTYLPGAKAIMKIMNGGV